MPRTTANRVSLRTPLHYHGVVLNEHTTVGGVTRSHDGNGNLTDDGTYKFGYDFENRLVELRNSTTSALIASYRYDALGRRVEKSVVAGATTRYVLDGVQVVEEFDGSNVWQARYVYEDGIDQPRSMDRADIADVNGNSNTTEVLRFHYHQQALGSVTDLTQPSGAVVEWVTYDVYGLPTIRSQLGTTVSQSAVGNPWLFTGREYDPESGLYFYRARTYDPATGRFLQRDPAGYVGGLTLFEYVNSQPVSARDPNGLDPMAPSQGAPPADESCRPHVDPFPARGGLPTGGGVTPYSKPRLPHPTGAGLEFLRAERRSRLRWEYTIRAGLPAAAAALKNAKLRRSSARKALDEARRREQEAQAAVDRAKRALEEFFEMQHRACIEIYREEWRSRPFPRSWREIANQIALQLAALEAVLQANLASARAALKVATAGRQVAEDNLWVADSAVAAAQAAYDRALETFESNIPSLWRGDGYSEDLWFPQYWEP